MPSFKWDQKAFRFRWAKNGQFVSFKKVNEARTEFISYQNNRINEIFDNIWAREVTIGAARDQLRNILRETYVAQYLLGKGGKAQMTNQDYGLIGSFLKKQYGFLDKFMGEIAHGKYNENQVKVAQFRARLYTASSEQAYQSASVNARGFGLYKQLPAMPGDGTTVCRTNCKCEWDVVKATGDILGPDGEMIPSPDNIWLATWKLNPAEHCATCLRRSEMWVNLRIELN